LVPGVQQVGGWRVEVDGPWPADVRPEERLVAWLRPEVVAQGLTVSSRRRGDRLEPLGMSGTTKKVQDLLVDARLPWAERDAVPIVRVGGRVAWVVGLRIAAWAAAAPGAPAVRVAFQRVDDAEPNGGIPPRPEMGRGSQPGSDTTRPRASSPELLGRFSNSLDGGGEEPPYW